MTVSLSDSDMLVVQSRLRLNAAESVLGKQRGGAARFQQCLNCVGINNGNMAGFNIPLERRFKCILELVVTTDFNFDFGYDAEYGGELVFEEREQPALFGYEELDQSVGI